MMPSSLLPFCRFADVAAVVGE